MRNRASRIVLGIIVLILFGVYSYLRSSSSPHSSDFDNPTAVTEVTAAPAEVQPIDAEPSPEVTEEPVETPEPTPELPQIDIGSWEFILANGDNSIAEYAPPELVTVEEQQVDSRIAEALKNMAADARAQGLNVYLSSGYRSYSEQAANFVRVCQNNGVADGKNAQGFYITMPAGCSEHQTGLACDITDVYYPLKDASIENTETFQYMSKHCQEFGFIVRFPKDKEQITGVMYEPFHYRYVGVEAATYIMEHGLCLEEFLELYK